MQERSHSVHDSLFWLCALALLFFQLGTTATWQSEDRFLEVAREMLLSGNYFKPTLNGELYFDKPLLGYWLILAARHITNGLNEWSLRLPSALAGLIALWTTRDLSRELWNAATARTAGWILLTAFGFLQWARLGEADMENLAASTAAVCWYWRHRERTRIRDYAGFYAILAIGAQCKGLTAIVVPLLALLPDLVRTPRIRLHFNTRHLIAIAIGAAIYLLPFWLSPEGVHYSRKAGDSNLPASGLGQVLRENIVRYVAPFDHTEPIHTYFIAVPQYLLPWSIAFLFALYWFLRDKTATIAHRKWLLSTIGLIFLFFTLSGSRRNYYILPLLPYCALLIAVYLQHGVTRNALRATAALLLIIGFAHISVWPLWPLLQRHADNALPLALRWQIAALGTVLVVLPAIYYVFAKRDSQRLLKACIAGAVILQAGFFFSTQLTLDRFRSEDDFAKRLATIQQMHPQARVATYRERPGGKLLFYAQLAPTVAVLRNQDELSEFLADGSSEKLLLVYHKYDDELPSSLRDSKAVLEEQWFAWEKNNREKMRAWVIAAKRD